MSFLVNFSCRKCADNGCLGTMVSLLDGLLYEVCHSLWIIAKIKLAKCLSEPNLQKYLPAKISTYTVAQSCILSHQFNDTNSFFFSSKSVTTIHTILPCESTLYRQNIYTLYTIIWNEYIFSKCCLHLVVLLFTLLVLSYLAYSFLSCLLFLSCLFVLT